MNFLEEIERYEHNFYGEGAYFFKNCKTGEITIFANNRIIESFEKIPYTPSSLAEDILIGFSSMGREVTLEVYDLIRNEYEFNPDLIQFPVLFNFFDELDKFNPDILSEFQKQLFFETLELINEFRIKNNLEIWRLNK